MYDMMHNVGSAAAFGSSGSNVKQEPESLKDKPAAEFNVDVQQNKFTRQIDSQVNQTHRELTKEVQLSRKLLSDCQTDGDRDSFTNEMTSLHCRVEVAEKVLDGDVSGLQ